MSLMKENSDLRGFLWLLFWLGLIVFPVAPLLWTGILIALAIHNWGPKSPAREDHERGAK